MKSISYEKRRLRIMASYVIGGKVLDIGYAYFPNPYLRRIYRVGYDMKEKPINTVSYEEHITGNVCDIAEKLKGRQFSTIICGELLEHLENPYSFLRDIRALLTPKGRLIVSTPNPAGFPIFLAELLLIKRFFYAPAHTYSFLPRWMERLLERTGFRLLKSKGVGLWLPMFNINYAPLILSYQIVYVSELKQPL